MTQETRSWNVHHWRDATTTVVGSHRNAPTSSHPPYPAHSPGPPASAPAAVISSSQALLLDDELRWSTRDAASGRSRTTQPSLSSSANQDSRGVPAASTFHARPYDGRHTPNSCDPQELDDNVLRGETSSVLGARSLHLDDQFLSGSTNNAPSRTLHAAQRQNLPRIYTSAKFVASGDSSNNIHYSAPSPSTSLPPFASFQEHASRTDDVDGPEIAPMSSRLSCYQCTKLLPLVKDVVAAVAELDDHVQTYCNKSTARAITVPQDASIRAVQWILERLNNAKHDIHDAARRSPGYFYHHHQQQQQQSSLPTAPSSHITPPNTLKRPGEQWERDDLQDPKRPRSGISNETPFQLPALTPREDRRMSIDLLARDSRLGYSPPPSDSGPGSAYPPAMSPTLSHRLNTRALPSPPSMAYPSASAPSLPPTWSVGSPATSCQAPSSIHTTSTSSATSAHIADLQHQVTVKSLEFQTLQSEYGSLLQKLQRERLKSQAIERKTAVADQEVNELTNKNEDLSAQVKALESQLEESEQKREAIGGEASRDKEQWGRMLDMSNRLQQKVASEKQRLLERTESLERQLRNQGGTPQNSEADRAEYIRPKPPDSSFATSAAPVGSFETANDTVSSLRREVKLLNRRAETLRFALERAKQHNWELTEITRSFLEKTTETGTAIDRALDEDLREPSMVRDDTRAWQHDQKGSATRSASQQSVPSPAPGSVQRIPTPAPTVSKPADSPSSGTFEVYNNGKIIKAKIADVTRAVSPGPEELGFHVMPSTSSPEELMKALGPAPAPLPSSNFVSQGSFSSLLSSETDRLNHWNRTPPRSYLSSPAEMMDTTSSSSGIGTKSPEAYASDPELSVGTEKRIAHPRPAAPHFHAAGPAPHSFVEGIHEWRRMPPPPRPESAKYQPRTQV